MVGTMDHILSIEKKGTVITGVDELEIIGDQAGLKYLKECIENLLNCEDSHIHLISEDWAGNEIASTPIVKGNSTIHKVTLVKLE